MQPAQALVRTLTSCDPAMPTACQKNNVNARPAPPDHIASSKPLSSPTRWVWGGLLVFWFIGL